MLRYGTYSKVGVSEKTPAHSMKAIKSLTGLTVSQIQIRLRNYKPIISENPEEPISAITKKQEDLSFIHAQETLHRQASMSLEARAADISKIIGRKFSAA